MARKPATPKPAAEKKPKPKAKPGPGHNVNLAFNKATFLDFRRKATETLRAMEVAKKAHDLVMQQCNAAGGDSKQLMKAIRAARDPEKAALELRTEIKYREWMGMPIGTQGSLLDDEGSDDHLTDTDKHDEIVFQAGEAGYRAGRAATDRHAANTFPAGSESYVAFDGGWTRGQASLAAELGENAKIITPKRGKGAEESGETKH